MTPARLLTLALGLLVLTDPDAAGQTGYLTPPDPVAKILAAPPPPGVSVSPTRDRLALVSTERYPPVAQLAEPMLRLAGLRINPVTNGPARETRITGVTFVDIATRKETPLTAPAGGLHNLQWCPDGRHFAVLGSVAEWDRLPGRAPGAPAVGPGAGAAGPGVAPGPTRVTVKLYVGDAATGQAVEVPNVAVNGVFGGYDWADADTLLVWAVPAGRGPAPVAPLAPAGPVVQEGSGKSGPVRTYQDLLTSRHDEALFRHHAAAQLTLVDRASLAAKPVGEPAIVPAADLSPDGKYLLVTRLREPFSYLHPYTAFPKAVEVLDRAGKLVHTVAELPLQDAVPIEGVPTGPRGVRWVPTAPATLFFATALDGGDPRKEVPFRDELFRHAAPFAAAPQSAGKTQHRFTGASFFPTGDALVSDYDRERRWVRTVKRDLADPAAEPAVVFDRSAQDRYNDPGSPVARQLPNGRAVLRTQDGKLWLSGAGATPQGDRPFLALYDPATKQSEKVFQSQPGKYETATLLSDDGKTLLVRRESPTEPGNFYLRTPEGETALTKFTDPYPPLRDVKKQLVTCKRADGVTVSFTLYTPPGYVPGTRLPAVFWAYPREFNSADTAGQVSGSPDRFVTLGGYSHLFFLTQGYAVMDEVSVPIVGPPATANDTFIEQLVGSAKAAIDKGVELGVVDRDRVGVGGHSYGAFMTAHFLAHSDLFRAGIARSGAYNRTLTPFGFQNERRTFWEAPEVYAKLSPFNAAHKINEPLLLIHGQADSNPGTFPVQSERMYQAVRGTGGTVRLVLLPHEDHGYQAKESIHHVLAESVMWFDKYVKNAPPRKAAP